MLHDRAQDTDDGQMRQSSKEDLHPTSFVQVGSAPEGARWALRLILLGRSVYSSPANPAVTEIVKIPNREGGRREPLRLSRGHGFRVARATRSIPRRAVPD